MSENLTLWRQIERTDPAQVKPITGKAYRGTSPKPHFLVFKATETFGPCGIGWGFEIVEEKLLDGAVIAEGFRERVHMARVRVWYEWNGKRGQVEHVGQTAFCGRRNDGKPYTDEDAPKKSVTDALIKALSMIGFAGDIFMGRYDDSRYVNELKREFADADRPIERPVQAPQTPDDEFADAGASERLAREMSAKLWRVRGAEAVKVVTDDPQFRQHFRALEEAEREVIGKLIVERRALT